MRRTLETFALGSICLCLSWSCNYDYSGASAASTTSTDSAGGASTTTDATAASTTGAGGMGGSAPVDPFYRSGTRLVANAVDFGGGTKQFLGWYDTGLKTNCTFNRFTDVDEVCTPPSADASTYYEDAACSEPLMSANDTGCGVPKYALTQGAASCDTPNAGGVAAFGEYATIRPTGSKFSGATVYNKQSGCASQAPPSGTTLWHTGASIALSTFATGKRTQEPREGSLTQEVIIGDDGSYQSNRPYFGPTPCHLLAPDTVNAPGTEVCAPYNLAIAEDDLFTDAGCTATQPVTVFERSNACFPQMWVGEIVENASSCNVGEQYFSVGRDDPSTYYAGSPAACATFTIANAFAVKIGAKIDPVATFGQLTLESRVGDHFAQRFHGTGIDAPVEAPTIIDSATTEPVEAITFDDGITRAVPETTLATASLFADAACTLPATWAPGDSACGPAPTMPTMLLAPSAKLVCASPTTTSAGLYAAKAFAGPLYLLNSSLACVMTTVPGGSTFYEAGAPVDLSGYPAVTPILNGQ